MFERIIIGVSSCLLGNNVRYNGGHKLNRYVRDTLGQFFDFVPVCPEVECGLPIPRETMRLVGDPENPRLQTSRSGIDHTEKMNSWASRRIKELEAENLCGFIFKKDSPSSGMQRVKVYNEKGMPHPIGSGLFAKAFMDHFPRIPVEEEGRLNDPKLRENFIERIFALKRWRKVLEQRKALGRLVEFHTCEKMLLMSHSPQHYRAMGKLVARGSELSLKELYETYEKEFMAALALKTTTAKNMNVLQHILGYFKKNLSADEKQELLEIIANYRRGHIPLVVPITLINHFVRKYQQSYLARQTYLTPHPIDLQLRNHC
jgi:uncharacterized protein YbgA (DUF1722 family)/uncharacterized protein YbbK (DUF523 family)